MRYEYILSALLLGAALMSRPALGNETAGGTVVISPETICAAQPDSDFCRSLPATTAPATAQYDTRNDAVYGTAATVPANSAPAMPHAPTIEALEARAPWMDGYIRWCDAFPQHGSC